MLNSHNSTLQADYLTAYKKPEKSFADTEKLNHFGELLSAKYRELTKRDSVKSDSSVPISTKDFDPHKYHMERNVKAKLKRSGAIKYKKITTYLKGKKITFKGIKSSDAVSFDDKHTAIENPNDFNDMIPDVPVSLKKKTIKLSPTNLVPSGNNQPYSLKSKCTHLPKYNNNPYSYSVNYVLNDEQTPQNAKFPTQNQVLSDATTIPQNAQVPSIDAKHFFKPTTVPIMAPKVELSSPNVTETTLPQEPAKIRPSIVPQKRFYKLPSNPSITCTKPLQSKTVSLSKSSDFSFSDLTGSSNEPSSHTAIPDCSSDATSEYSLPSNEPFEARKKDLDKKEQLLDMKELEIKEKEAFVEEKEKLLETCRKLNNEDPVLFSKPFHLCSKAIEASGTESLSSIDLVLLQAEDKDSVASGDSFKRAVTKKKQEFLNSSTSIPILSGNKCAYRPSFFFGDRKTSKQVYVSKEQVLQFNENKKLLNENRVLAEQLESIKEIKGSNPHMQILKDLIETKRLVGKLTKELNEERTRRLVSEELLLCKKNGIKPEVNDLAFTISQLKMELEKM
ncbi:hypothetical protein KAFR_0D02810 [Kazachstania africana CBS 2517]|uniref:Uncharacterized protein n=1 Tax=Kazachstania africana (strain ATCC 22294 / BCRC 22015 / CBS 2517 / CECT 1963 / NBRC 1671 / NRRL Y-8276) TaxID=1071382 RepID=H2AU79_KAZAF|nr:hypothetical protein KAFR_0D02810 [Kazachstania africana CBS 2517]CCF57929.1 hypothetical protein KAFR_0D02810 [Kazachstania africana CBS 2517]